MVITDIIYLNGEVKWHLEDFENDRTLVVRSDKGKDVVGGRINKG